MSTLNREIGLFGATMMGLGSIIGTGVFVSIGIAAGAAGPSVVIAIALAALVALCNGLSSAQLAANHPVSGGTYEYGYDRLGPAFGFTAGWTFLLAKSASAATAALGCAGYLLNLCGIPARWMTPMALFITVLLTLIVLSGIRRANWFNIVIVSVTIISLAIFTGAGVPSLFAAGSKNFFPLFGETGTYGLLQATALMFVAYTGYGRIATLGEEVIEPETTIPRAIILTLAISGALYLGVSIVAVGSIGSPKLSAAAAEEAAPLQAAAAAFRWERARLVVAAGAVTSMAGVLFNLILGLSRVLLAMARRHDMPHILAEINSVKGSPSRAICIVGLTIAMLVLIGNVKTTWSFSAFTVLIYYALTNLAALRLTSHERLYSPFFAAAGLFGCTFLAFWVELKVWLIGLTIIGFGTIWHAVRKRIG